MYYSFINQNSETLGNSDDFSVNLENSLIDSNNSLFGPPSPNLDESYEFQSDKGIERNESENSFEDRLNIEISSHNIYPTENTGQQRDNILFAVHKDGSLRGRKRTKIENTNSFKKHDKYYEDNIKRKLQVHFINFIIKYINLILIQRGFDTKLLKISSSSKQNESQKKFLLLKQMNIEQILSLDISPKYKKEKNKHKNAELIKEIKHEPIIYDLLSANFLKVFRELYYNEKGINLKLPKDIKIYKDLVNINKNDPIYVKKLDQCLHKYFLC